MAGDMMRSVREMQGRQQEVLDAVSGTGQGAAKTVHDLKAFFTSPDNLIALAVCLAAVIGLYRLLRSENIIPRYRVASGNMLSGFLARRLALRLMVLLTLFALGLALAAGHAGGLLESLKSLF